MPAFNEFDDAVADESTTIGNVVEDGMTEILKMNTDLMGSASYRVTLQQRTICLFIEPKLLKYCFAILYVYV